MAIEWETHFQDGNYGTELSRISPEGNVYGQTRFVRDWPHWVWWDGSKYRDYSVAGQLNSASELPSGRQTFGLTYEVKEKNERDGQWYWKAYFYDSSNPGDPWRQMKTFWEVESESDLPIPGVQVGALHKITEHHIMVFWTGFQWERLKHHMLDTDEDERHLPPGFLDWLIPDVEVVFVNEYELVLEPVEGGTGAVFVGGELITASPDTAVFAETQALNLIGGVLQTTDLQADTEYWIYIANNKSVNYNLGNWDYRGRLFLSTTTPVDGYLGTGIGLYARLAGRIQTTSETLFARELDISLLSNRSSLTHAFREFSDYVIEFIDQDTLRLQRLDGTYGQIFIPDSLRYVGFDYDITTSDDWVAWSESGETHVTLESTYLAPSTRYYIYMAGKVDPFNFNEVNPDTGRPWTESDVGAEDNYVSALDLRLKPFLSPQAPDHGRLSETWPGFYTRWIGQVSTDANSRFKNARDLSMIRQPTLDPTYFDGLAEITFVAMGENDFRVAKISSTSGIVNVGGEAVQTYDKDDSQNVHKASTSDIVQAYTEASPSDPLSDLNAVSTYTSQTLYLYLANSRSLWGDYANKLFFSTTAPTGGYLSQNWPGNQARWLADVRISSTGTFAGSFIEDAVSPPALILDDESISSNEVWSSQKINAELQKLYFQIDATTTFNSQKTQGCAVKLQRVDDDTIKLYPMTEGVVVVFPDLTYLEIPTAGVSYDVSTSSALWDTFYYMYLNDSGLYLSTTPPDTQYTKMHTLGTDSVLVGYVTTGGFVEDIPDTTFSDNSDITRRNRRGAITNWVRDSDSKGHFTDGATAQTLGVGNDCPLVRKYHSVEIDGTPYTIINIVDDGEGTDEVWLDADAASGSATGIYAEVVDNGSLKASEWYEYDGSLNPRTDYATADMTSNTSPSPNVVSSYPTSSTAYYVFDQYVGTAKEVHTNPTYGITDIYFDTGSGNSFLINKWRIRHGYIINEVLTYVTSAKLYGSNVASPGPGDWDLLDNESFSASSQYEWSSYRTFTNSTLYRHFRLEITGIQGSGIFGAYLFEIQLVHAGPIADTDIVVSYPDASLQLDAHTWSHIFQIAGANLGIHSGSDVFGAFSFDNRATWHLQRSGSWTQIVRFNTVWQYHDGTSWQDASEDTLGAALEDALRDGDNQFSWTDIDDLDENDWKDTGGFDDDLYFDFAVGIKPGGSWGSPAVDGITGSVKRGNRQVCGGWNVYSFWNQAAKEWYETIDDYRDGDDMDDVPLVLPGCFIPAAGTGGIERTEESRVKFYISGSQYCIAIVWGTGEDICNFGLGNNTLTVTLTPSSLTPQTRYDTFVLAHTESPTHYFDYLASNGVLKFYWNAN